MYKKTERTGGSLAQEATESNDIQTRSTLVPISLSMQLYREVRGIIDAHVIDAHLHVHMPLCTSLPSKA